jgi:lipopolysaccharide/colanic/teichoic acid biosynthesis glycosyltransferase
MTAERTLRQRAKRAADVVLAGGVLVFASPLLAGAAAAVLVALGRPILFRQVRIGLDDEPFTLLKLRTMRESVGSDGQPLPDAERMTRLGDFLRKSSLDELPQLLNVLRGEMSLVGPRPLLTQYLGRYSDRQRRRHEVLPGITGWAQVTGRNSLSWGEKLERDVWYVDNWSLALDASILARTAVGVVRRRDVSASGHATMPEFMGSEDDPSP